MSDGKLDFLDETPEAEEPEAVEAATLEPKPEAEGTGETASPPEAPVETPKAPEAHTAPLTALLDEREKRQAAERELNQLREWRRQQEAQARAAQQKVPDVFEDPQGFVAHSQQTFQSALIGTKMEMSKFLAERDFGAELVNEAFAFYEANPQLSQQFVSHPSPWHAGVEFYKQQKAIQEIGNDPEGWKKSQMDTLREQIKAELLAEMQGAVPAKPKPPVSLAGQPAAGRGEPKAAPGSAFDQIFGT